MLIYIVLHVCTCALSSHHFPSELIACFNDVVFSTGKQILDLDEENGFDQGLTKVDYCEMMTGSLDSLKCTFCAHENYPSIMSECTNEDERRHARHLQSIIGQTNDAHRRRMSSREGEDGPITSRNLRAGRNTPQSNIYQIPETTTAIPDFMYSDFERRLAAQSNATNATCARTTVAPGYGSDVDGSQYKRTIEIGIQNVNLGAEKLEAADGENTNIPKPEDSSPNEGENATRPEKVESNVATKSEEIDVKKVAVPDVSARSDQASFINSR